MTGFPLADTALARRVESAIVSDLSSYVHSARSAGVYPGAEEFRVGGGGAYWFSDDNPVNGAFGLGMRGPVEHEEIAALVAFFEERGTPARVDVCPHADATLMRWLAEERFVTTTFEMLLYQPLPATASGPPSPGVTVREACTAEERALWAELEARGFTDDAVTEEHRLLARAISLRQDAQPFIGYLDGEPAGTGMLVTAGGIAMLNGDSTLPASRNRGVQSAILAERLVRAAAAGCDLAVIEAAPGGVSQRNQERAGFRIAYNRVTLERPFRTAR